MSTLEGQSINQTYKDLLQVSNSNSGVDGTLRAVEDGEGTVSALEISTTDVRVNNLTVTGTVTGLPSSATNLSTTANGTSLTVNSDTGTNASIPAATTSAWGAMTDEDKTKLNSIDTGATANDTDANLKNRANHTGTQAASTISDFDTEVANNTAVQANTAKVGITTAQANAIVANTAKVGITTAQANAIVANTAKVGITTAQANAITANTAKVSNATHTGDVTGSTGLTIANNAVTAAKISGVDGQFLVDTGLIQKKVVVNEAGADVDFRVEGNSNANLISTNGSTNNVGIGGAPSATAATTLLVSGIDSKFVSTGSNNNTVWSQSPLGSPYFILYAQNAPANGKRVNMSVSHLGDGTGKGKWEATWVNDNNTAGQGMIFKTDGSLTIGGAFSASSKSFKIDHPLASKKDTHHLLHMSVESPQADLIYRGKVTLVDGAAKVNIDTANGMTEGTFVALCTDVQCFTSNESDWDAVKGNVDGNILTINCQNSSSTATISWMVVGERQDQQILDASLTDENGKVIVEPAK